MDMSSELTPFLRDLYHRLPRDLNRGPVVEGMVQELLRLYQQDHRHYHNLVHVSECLSEFRDVFTVCEDANACEMAIWYHDIIYEPGEPTNERLSANKARFDCMRLHVSEKLSDKVFNLILSTTHTNDVIGDAAFVSDIDLAIFARPWERYSEYEAQIRKEYSMYSDKEYLAGRALFLDGMLRKPHIYFTDYFRNKYEKIAKANIALSLMKLRTPHA